MKHAFCVDSALHLLQREVAQLICLTVYAGTTQLSTTNAKPDLNVTLKKKKMLQECSILTEIPVFFHLVIYIAALRKIDIFFQISRNPS